MDEYFCGSRQYAASAAASDELQPCINGSPGFRPTLDPQYRHRYPVDWGGPSTGPQRMPKGSPMMRKTSLILFGAAVGVVVSLVTTQPRPLLDGLRAQAATTDEYRPLRLFNIVFERVRADYVEEPDDRKLMEAAINGMLAGLDPHC